MTLKATHIGEVPFPGVNFKCANLDDKRRVVYECGFSDYENQGGIPDIETPLFLPPFPDLLDMARYLSKIEDDRILCLDPIYFEMPKGEKIYGFDADIIADFLFFKRLKGGESEDDLYLERLYRVTFLGLCHVGIIPLIDEATGYQDARTQGELRDIFNELTGKRIEGEKQNYSKRLTKTP